MIATEFGFVFFHQYPKPAFAKYLLFFKYPYLKLPCYAWKNNSEYNLNVEFKKWMPNYWERVKLILCFCMQVHLFILLYIYYELDMNYENSVLPELLIFPSALLKIILCFYEIKLSGRTSHSFYSFPAAHF